MKPYPKYKDSGVEWIGEVPEGWDVKKLKYLAKVKTGYTPSKSIPGNYSMDGMVWAKPEDLQQFSPILDSKERISKQGVKDGSIIPKDSILVCCIGTIGKIGIAGVDLITNQQINALIFNSSIKSEFGKYTIFSSETEHIKEANGNVVKILNGETQKNIVFAVPTSSEQTTIAAFLDRKTAEIDSLIANKERLIELYEEEKAAVINHAVTKGLDPDAEMKDSGIEWLGEIPAHWEVKRLRYIGDCQNGVSKSGEYFGAGFPFITYGDVYNKFVLPEQPKGLANSTEDDQKNYSVVKGDVFFTRTSETIEEIGIASSCLKTIDQAVFSGFLIRFRPIEGILLEGFSKYYFRANIHRLFFVKEMNLVTRASLSQELLKKLPVLIPPIQVQEKIASYLDQIETNFNSIISKFKRQIELLKEYRTALISEAVTGKIDLRNEI